MKENFSNTVDVGFEGWIGNVPIIDDIEEIRGMQIIQVCLDGSQ